MPFSPPIVKQYTLYIEVGLTEFFKRYKGSLHLFMKLKLCFITNRGRKCPVSWWTKLLFNDGRRHINIHTKTIVIHGRVVSGRNGVHQQMRIECDLQYFLFYHVNIGKCAQRRSMTSIWTLSQKYYLPLEKLQLIACVSHTCMTDWMN